VKLNITVDGKVYEVEVEVSEPDPPHASYYPGPGAARVPAAPAAAVGVPAPAAASGGPVADESKVCRSPLAGVVNRVQAQVAQAIQANDPLLVLEAMKMETVITAHAAGKIARINAAPGDAVQQGQVLVEFE
jgi:methylmalonyl-CoA carboxyltransferase small subunit